MIFSNNSTLYFFNPRNFNNNIKLMRKHQKHSILYKLHILLKQKQLLLMCSQKPQNKNTQVQHFPLKRTTKEIVR